LQITGVRDNTHIPLGKYAPLVLRSAAREFPTYQRIVGEFAKPISDANS
jgi:hypothetical protein